MRREEEIPDPFAFDEEGLEAEPEVEPEPEPANAGLEQLREFKAQAEAGQARGRRLGSVRESGRQRQARKALGNEPRGRSDAGCPQSLRLRVRGHTDQAHRLHPDRAAGGRRCRPKEDHARQRWRTSPGRTPRRLGRSPSRAALSGTTLRLEGVDEYEGTRSGTHGVGVRHRGARPGREGSGEAPGTPCLRRGEAGRPREVRALLRARHGHVAGPTQGRQLERENKRIDLDNAIASRGERSVLARSLASELAAIHERESSLRVEVQARAFAEATVELATGPPRTIAR